MKKVKSWDAASYDKHADFVSRLGLPLVSLLKPKAHESILDLGCGSGELALEIQNYGANVIGVDISPDMIKKSKALGLEAYVKDVVDIEYTEAFNAVFSNAVLHWLRQKTLAIEKIYNALKKEGRFVAEFGGEGNISQLIDAMEEVFKNNDDFGIFNNPWYFPSVKEYKTLLEEQGFKLKYIELITRPTAIDDISHWLDIFANGIVSHLNDAQRQRFKDEVKAILINKLYTKEEGWVIDYVRLRLHAIKC